MRRRYPGRNLRDRFGQFSSAQHFVNRDTGFADGLQAVARIFNQAAAQQFPDAPVYAGRQRVPDRFFLDYRRQRVGDTFAGERLFVREHFVKHSTEGPDVGAAVDSLALGLLG